MHLPQIAIVGRPNVGKSSLLNRLAGKRVSIVDATPGVTRDRVSAIVVIEPPTETPKGTPRKIAEIIDTGGFGVYMAEGKRFDEVGADLSTLTDDIEAQIHAAIAQADLVLLVADAQTGITALDHAIASLIRRAGFADKVIPVANKVDEESWMGDAADAGRLGFGQPMMFSASTGFGSRELTELIYERLGDSGLEKDLQIDAEAKVAIVGKRNSGKSTLINAWAGEERVIVSEIAGTTRDSIDVRLDFEGRRLLAIDTAGARKRKSFADDIEFYAHTRMIAAIDRADVVLLLIDATQDVSQVDQKLAQEVQERFKPAILVVNKWDMVEGAATSRDRKGAAVKPADYLEYLTQQLRGLEYAPIVFISAKTGEGLDELAGMIFNLHEQAHHRETTGRLNAAIADVLKKRGPSTKGGRPAKVYYVSQVASNPPTIVLVVNDPELFKGRYERYLLNELREVVPFSEVPIRLFFRQRERAPLEEMKRKGRGRQREQIAPQKRSKSP